MAADSIPGIKLIRFNTAKIDLPDDLTYPFKLEAIFRPPDFMTVAFVGIYGGSEEIVVRGLTKEALDKFLEVNELRRHPRLNRLTITGPKEIVEQFPKGS